jgi:hypothetical protein
VLIRYGHPGQTRPSFASAQTTRPSHPRRQGRLSTAAPGNDPAVSTTTAIRPATGGAMPATLSAASCCVSQQR